MELMGMEHKLEHSSTERLISDKTLEIPKAWWETLQVKMDG